MKWRDLKKFVNELDEKELDKDVHLWREDEAITDIEVEQLGEDHYINVDDPETGCFPESLLKDLGEDIQSKKVWDKGHPVLFENF